MHSSFCKCCRTARNGMAGHMRSAGRSFPTAALDSTNMLTLFKLFGALKDLLLSSK